MAKREVNPKSTAPKDDSCYIVWSEPDSEGYKHVEGFVCDTPEARDRIAEDLEDQELIVRVRSVQKE